MERSKGCLLRHLWHISNWSRDVLRLQHGQGRDHLQGGQVFQLDKNDAGHGQAENFWINQASKMVQRPKRTKIHSRWVTDIGGNLMIDNCFKCRWEQGPDSDAGCSHWLAFQRLCLRGLRWICRLCWTNQQFPSDKNERGQDQTWSWKQRCPSSTKHLDFDGYKIHRTRKERLHLWRGEGHEDPCLLHPSKHTVPNVKVAVKSQFVLGQLLARMWIGVRSEHDWNQVHAMVLSNCGQAIADLQSLGESRLSVLQGYHPGWDLRSLSARLQWSTIYHYRLQLSI